MGPRSIKGLIVVGKIDGSLSTVGGLLGDCQRRAIRSILVKENKIGRREGVLHITMRKL